VSVTVTAAADAIRAASFWPWLDRWTGVLAFLVFVGLVVFAIVAGRVVESRRPRPPLAPDLDGAIRRCYTSNLSCGPHVLCSACAAKYAREYAAAALLERGSEPPREAAAS
jgi:hypothetical protein